MILEQHQASSLDILKMSPNSRYLISKLLRPFNEHIEHLVVNQRNYWSEEAGVDISEESVNCEVVLIRHQLI